jgi:hypothetical protein
MSYGTPADLAKYGATSDWLADISTGDQQAALDAAKAHIDSHLANRGTLPLTGSVPIEIIRIECQIAAGDLAVSHGASPEYAGLLTQRAAQAKKEIAAIGTRSANPPGLVFSQPADPAPTDSGGPRTISNAKRGWSFP